MFCTWIIARVDTSGHVLPLPFKGPGAVANGLTCTQKGAGEVSLHLKLELNTLTVFQVFQQIKV